MMRFIAIVGFAGLVAADPFPSFERDVVNGADRRGLATKIGCVCKLRLHYVKHTSG